MSGPGDWPGDETAETQRLALPGAERQILAALAVVGGASLSADELTELAGVDDVIPLVEDLERRGLVRREERKRYSVHRRVGEQIRRSDEGLAAGDRLLRNFTTLARRGALTPQRAADDAQAFVGLSEWAAETRRWAGLLELVQALEASFGIAQHAQDWRTLLEHALVAARSLGDRPAEIWVLQQLATASAATGDIPTAQRYLREADELQRGPQQTMRREVTTEQPAAAAAGGGGGVPTAVFWIAGIILALAAGVGLGFVLDNGGSNAGGTTAPVSVTLTRGGTTVTTQETVTLPATTLTTASLTTTTETVTTTTVATTTLGVP
jgi:hypothetical protein